MVFRILLRCMNSKNEYSVSESLPSLNQVKPVRINVFTRTTMYAMKKFIKSKLGHEKCFLYATAMFDKLKQVISSEGT